MRTVFLKKYKQRIIIFILSMANMMIIKILIVILITLQNETVIKFIFTICITYQDVAHALLNHINSKHYQDMNLNVVNSLLNQDLLSTITSHLIIPLQIRNVVYIYGALLRV